MNIPIQKQGDLVISSIQATPTDAEMLEWQVALADRAAAWRSRGAVIDVSALDVIDSFTSRTLQSVAGMLKLRGARVAVVGIQPPVAFAMVRLGLRLQGIETGLDLEDGLTRLRLSVDLPV